MVCLAGIRFYFRWVPSEFNNADKGSRLYDANKEPSKLLTAFLCDKSICNDQGDRGEGDSNVAGAVSAIQSSGDVECINKLAPVSVNSILSER